MLGISPSRLIADRRAVTMLEYGIIAGLIVLACVASITVIGTQVQAFYNAVVAAYP